MDERRRYAGGLLDWEHVGLPLNGEFGPAPATMSSREPPSLRVRNGIPTRMMSRPDARAGIGSDISLRVREPVKLFLRNLNGAPHDVAIYADATAAKARVVRETVSDEAVVYETPPLQPGAYLFRCGLEPQMTGTLILEG